MPKIGIKELIVSAIDLGTNTARLMVARVVDTYKLMVLKTDREIIRLGAGFSRQKKILPEGLDLAIKAIERFSAKARELKAETIHLIGTSALREAENSLSIQQSLYDKTGLRVQVISGEMEAILTSYGAIYTLGLVPQNLIIVDVGGGSTELAFFSGQEKPFFLSLPLGVVWLSEKFSDYNQLIHFLNTYLETVNLPCLEQARFTLVGTGGTATTLAAILQRLIEYDPAKINRFSASISDLELWQGYLASLPVQERVKVPGLEKGREDIILAGLALFLALMKKFGLSEMTVSDAGLLEGIIFHKINPFPLADSETEEINPEGS